MKLEVIIGLEIHAQLSTKSKLFCSCDNDAWGAEPNTRVCPVCMGFPGMLPVMNEVAVQKAAQAATALGCGVQEFSKMDRKNYFYPDLPTGYQISQYDQPVSEKGVVEVEVEGKLHKIGITRVHIENDAGKLVHAKDATLLDYNRAGTPLVEIVTEPDLRSGEQAQVFAKEVQKLLRFVGASSADMEKGMMRFDASVSLREKGSSELNPRTEIKNLNSFASLRKAIEYEVKRQTKYWKEHGPQDGETTVGWVDGEGKTVLMRSKESANDYRYFPEPDLPPLVFVEEEIQKFREAVPELPLEKYHRYRKEMGLSENDALKLAESLELSAFFEEAAELVGNPKKAANVILSVVLADSGWQRSEITPQHVADALDLVEEGKVSSTGVKDIVVRAMETGGKAKEIMEELGLEQVNDTGELEKWVEEVMAENGSVVEDYKAGKEKALQFLMGQVMKRSGGSANPPMVMEMLKQKLT